MQIRRLCIGDLLRDDAQVVRRALQTHVLPRLRMGDDERSAKGPLDYILPSHLQAIRPSKEPIRALLIALHRKRCTHFGCVEHEQERRRCFHKRQRAYQVHLRHRKVEPSAIQSCRHTIQSFLA